MSTADPPTPADPPAADPPATTSGPLADPLNAVLDRLTALERVMTAHPPAGSSAASIAGTAGEAI